MIPQSSEDDLHAQVWVGARYLYETRNQQNDGIGDTGEWRRGRGIARKNLETSDLGWVRDAVQGRNDRLGIRLTFELHCNRRKTLQEMLELEIVVYIHGDDMCSG